MSQANENIQPLYLTEEETLALLDLCLASDTGSDPMKECALMKLSNLARHYLAEKIEQEEKDAETPAEAESAESAIAPLPDIARLFASCSPVMVSTPSHSEHQSRGMARFVRTQLRSTPRR